LHVCRDPHIIGTMATITNDTKPRCIVHTVIVTLLVLSMADALCAAEPLDTLDEGTVAFLTLNRPAKALDDAAALVLNVESGSKPELISSFVAQLCASAGLARLDLDQPVVFAFVKRSEDPAKLDWALLFCTSDFEGMVEDVTASGATVELLAESLWQVSRDDSHLYVASREGVVFVSHRDETTRDWLEGRRGRPLKECLAAEDLTRILSTSAGAYVAIPQAFPGLLAKYDDWICNRFAPHIVSQLSRQLPVANDDPRLAEMAGFLQKNLLQLSAEVDYATAALRLDREGVYVECKMSFVPDGGMHRLLARSAAAQLNPIRFLPPGGDIVVTTCFNPELFALLYDEWVHPVCAMSTRAEFQAIDRLALFIKDVSEIVQEETAWSVQLPDEDQSTMVAGVIAADDTVALRDHLDKWCNGLDERVQGGNVFAFGIRTTLAYARDVFVYESIPVDRLNVLYETAPGARGDLAEFLGGRRIDLLIAYPEDLVCVYAGQEAEGIKGVIDIISGGAPGLLAGQEHLLVWNRLTRDKSVGVLLSLAKVLSDFRAVSLREDLEKCRVAQEALREAIDAYRTGTGSSVDELADVVYGGYIGPNGLYCPAQGGQYRLNRGEITCPEHGRLAGTNDIERIVKRAKVERNAGTLSALAIALSNNYGKVSAFIPTRDLLSSWRVIAGARAVETDLWPGR